MRTTKGTDQYRLYLKAFHRTAQAYAENPDQDTMPFAKKLIFYGVRTVNTQPKPEYITRESALNDFQFTETVLSLIGTLTPGQFITLFPITKDFDGHRYQTKDYFYTRDYIKTLPSDKPIADSVTVNEFLWEYHNWEVSHFLINTFGYIDNLRKLEGQPSMMEEFCD